MPSHNEVIFTYYHDQKKAAALESALSDYAVSSLTFNQGEPESHQQLYRLLFEVNALGPLWLTEEILGRIKKQLRGKIINIPVAFGI